MTKAQKKLKERIHQIERAEVRIFSRRTPIGNEYFSFSDLLVTETEESRKCCLLGLGKGGASIVREIADAKPDQYHSLGIKLSNNTLKMNVPLSRKLNSFAAAHETVYVVTTLGKRGRHSISVKQIIKHLYQIRRDIVLIVVKPFLFEVLPGTMYHINKTIKALEHYTHKQYCFSNEDSGYGHLPIREAWKQMTVQIASVIEKDFKDHTKKDKL